MRRKKIKKKKKQVLDNLSVGNYRFQWRIRNDYKFFVVTCWALVIFLGSIFYNPELTTGQCNHKNTG